MGFTVNGQEFQHALVDLQAVGSGIAPYQFSRFKSIDYENAAEKEAVPDHQGQQVAYVIKAQKTQGNVSMLLSEWFKLRDNFLRPLASAASKQVNRNVGIAQVAFDLTVQYGQTLATLKKDRLIGAMIQKEPRKSSDDQAVLVVEIPLFILNITDDQGIGFVIYDQ
jgi:hypothetical protein